MEGMRPDESRVSMEVDEIEEKIDYTVAALDDKTLAVTYKDEFVPSLVHKVIRSVDIEPIRLRIRARIYEVNTDALMEYGTKIGIYAEHGSSTTENTVDSSNGDIGLNLALGMAKGVSPAYNALDITAMIRALESTGDAQIMAEPSVMIYEGKRARLVEGRTYPIRTNTTTVTNENTSTTSSYSNVDTGLVMDLNFEQFRSGMIYLKMGLKIDQVESYDSAEGQIVTSKRELQSDLMVTPGSQVDLAGLSREVTKETKGGIPILREIPFIGKIFEYTRNESEKSMVIVQLQAEIVKHATFDVWKEPEPKAPAKKLPKEPTVNSDQEQSQNHTPKGPRSPIVDSIFPH